MPRANRDWKTFDDRWGRLSRFERFLPLSLAVHALLAAVVALPVLSAHQEKKQLQVEEERLQTEKKKEQEKALDEAKQEVKAVLKEELSAEELKKFFKELTFDYLDAKMADAYWDDLAMELQLDLDGLAKLFEDAAKFDPALVEKEIMNLKEKLVRQLAELAARKQLEPLQKEVEVKAAAMVKNLAQMLKEGLVSKVAHPAGDDMHKMVQAEMQAAQTALQRADQELAQLHESAQRLAKDLDRSTAHLQELDKKQAQLLAAPKKDAKALAQIKKEAGAQRLEMLAAGKGLKALQTRMKVVGKDLVAHLPQAAEALQELEAKTVEAAATQVQAVAKLATEGKLTEAAGQASAGKNSMQKTAAELERLQTAVQLQLAAMQAERLARQFAGQTRSVEAQAKAQVELAKTKDAKELARLAEEMTKSVKQAGDSAEETKQLAKQLGRLEGKTAKDSDPKKGDLKGKAEAVQGQVEQAKLALEGKAADKAADKLKGAGQKLEELRKEIATAQAKTGLGGGSNAEALLKKLDDLRRDKLAGDVQKKLEQAVKDKALPALVQKIKPALDKQLKGDQAAMQKFQAELAKTVNKLMAKELGEMKAAEEFAKAAGAKLPEPAGKESAKPASEKRVQELAGKAESSVRQGVDKSIAALVDSGVKQLPGVTFPKGTDPASSQASALLKRLAQFQKQLKEGRNEFLGRSDAAGVAGAMRRYQDRVGSLGRSGGLYEDAKAYRKMVEAIKGRGLIVGEEWLRKGAEGNVAKVETEDSLRPALLVLPEPPAAKTDEPKPLERKVKEPSFKTHRFAGVPFLADDAIKIDGDLADWKDLPSIELEPVLRPASPLPIKVKPATQKAWVAYCTRGLLVAVDVIDTSGELENKHPPSGAFWLNDCVEIYLDTLNTKDSGRGHANTHQFFAFPLGAKDDEGAGGFESHIYLENQREQWKKVGFPQEVMPRAGKKTEQGWTLEMLIPRSALRRGDIKPGKIIGFNLQIDTGTHLFYFWTCNIQLRTSMHPDTWGDIQFLGSDARIEVVAADVKEPVKSIVPGQPLRIRVSDPDMNLDEEKKDKISVTVRTAGGDSETLVLEETGNQSGVFLGAVPTRLDIGVRQAGFLEVLEGETVTVEYLDQARRYGERNVPIRETFAVSSLGVILTK